MLQKARELKPDVISMDINMPKLDGITALQIIVEENICPVVMLSSLTHKGAGHDAAAKALIGGGREAADVTATREQRASGADRKRPLS